MHNKINQQSHVFYEEYLDILSNLQPTVFQNLLALLVFHVASLVTYNEYKYS